MAVRTYFLLFNKLFISNFFNFTRHKSDYSKNVFDDHNKYKLLYNPEIEKLVNEQINKELRAAKSYLAMHAYFSRIDVGFLGCAGYFYAMFIEENYHATRFICYQNYRAGQIRIEEPGEKFKWRWCDFGEALCDSLEMEMNLGKKLYHLRKEASGINIYDCESFLDNFLKEQHRSIRELGTMISRFNSIKDKGLATYLMNEELIKKFPYKNSVTCDEE